MLQEISNAGVIIAIALAIISIPIIIYNKYMTQSRIIKGREKMRESIPIEKRKE